MKMFITQEEEFRQQLLQKQQQQVKESYNNQNSAKQNKPITISLNPVLLDVIDKIVFIYDKTIEDYVKEAVEMAVNSDLNNEEHELGKKTCEKLKKILTENGPDIG